MSDDRSRLELSQVTIGVLTALEVEYAACREIFDPEEAGVEQHRDSTSGQLTCWLCRVTPRQGAGEHIVAISLLPEIGNNAAAIATNNLLQYCSNMRYVIMCGIAGAVPNIDNPEEHVRLGDIVVTNHVGIIQYDRGKQRDPLRSASDPLAGMEFRGPPRPPCVDLLAAVKRIHADEERLGQKELRSWELKINEFLDRCADPEKWKRPYHNKDVLCDTTEGTGKRSNHPRDRARRSIGGIRCPRIFRGPIGAANIVLADPRRRDALRSKHQIKAVEMEGSGIADASWVARSGYLVIRGTCDYCNSQKNDEWHSYAALIAATYACTVVEYMHPVSIPHEPSIGDSNITIPVSAVGQVSNMRSPENPASPITHRRRAEADAIITPNRGLATVSSSDLGISDHNSKKIQPFDENIRLEISPTTIMLVEQLTAQVKNLMEEFRWPEARNTAGQLEKLLERIARKGDAVRNGWMTLAKVEEQRLRSEVRPHEIDISRLKALRMEAESVVY